MNDILPVCGSFLVRVTLLIGSGLVIATVLQRRRPLVASSVLSATTVGLLLLPLLAALMPAIAVPIRAPMAVEVTESSIGAGSPTENSWATAIDDEVQDRVERGRSSPVNSAAGDRGADALPARSRAVTHPSLNRSILLWIAVPLNVIGMIILSIRLINSLRIVRELRRTALPVGREWTNRLEHWQECLGVNRRVALATSDTVAVPMTVGWLRPIIFVPAPLHAASAAHQDAILLHELAHVRRGDYLHLVLLQVTQIVYWWHPLTWFIGILGRQLCERACDDLCVHWIGDRASYCDSLIAIARQTVCRPSLALGLAMAHTSHLARRVAHLGRCRGSEGCVPGSVVGLSIFGGVALAALLVALIEFRPMTASADEKGAAPGKPPAGNADKAAPRKTPQGADDLARTARTDSEVNRQLDRLDELRPKGGEDEWAMVLRDLIELGPEAVPELIAEMDATDNEYMLRCLAFVLRGIGDKRAIPALIRTLPKTCVSPRSDMGYIAKDPRLLAFMQEHDMEDGPIGGTRYSFGRAINEYRVALQKLTGTTHDETEIVHVFLQGTPRQQSMQRQLYQRCAERWADWWKMHWKEFVKDERDARVELSSLENGSNSANEFPHGPNVQFDGRHGNHILESSRNPKAKFVFLDLDTGRTRGLPEHLKLAAGQPKRLDDVLAWAAREGFDLMGTEYSPPKSEKSHYVLRGLGLNAWQIETDAWKRLDIELKKPALLKMGPRIEGLLAQYDPMAGQYQPEDLATFLFQTREGGYGAIFIGVEVHDDRLQPGGANDGDDELRPIAFSKGRRFAYTLISVDEAQKPGGGTK